MDFLWSTHPAFCGIHKLETLFLQYQGRKLGPIKIPVITALVWTEQGFTQAHTLLSAILLQPLQKPLTVAKAKAQRGDLNLETAIWALSHRFVPWGFSTASHAPSVQKPVPSCTVPLHILQHFVPVWLTQGVSPLLSTKDLDSPFPLPQSTLLGNPAYTTVILKKTALCEDMGCTTLTILLNPSFTWFGSGTIVHHSTWSMPGSCAFDQPWRYSHFTKSLSS